MQVPKDSKMPLDWVVRACTQNPICKLIDDKTGQFVGNYSTGPVRLAWTKDLTDAKKTENGDDRWGCTVLFPPGVDLTPLVAASNEAAAMAFPENMTAAGFQWGSLLSPWHDQFEKASKYSGYTPGAWFFNVGTYFKPRIVDTMMNDIVDMSRLYAGVWAILAVNCYAYPTKGRPTKGPTKKGVAFGLQSTVLIADDTPFGGGGMDPRAAFKGIKIDANVNPAAAFNRIMPPAASPSTVSNLDQMRAMGLIP